MVVTFFDKLDVRVDKLRRLQSTLQDELEALLPPLAGMISVLDRAFKGEL